MTMSPFSRTSSRSVEGLVACLARFDHHENSARAGHARRQGGEIRRRDDRRSALLLDEALGDRSGAVLDGDAEPWSARLSARFWPMTASPVTPMSARSMDWGTGWSLPLGSRGYSQPMPGEATPDQTEHRILGPPPGPGHG